MIDITTKFLDIELLINNRIFNNNSNTSSDNNFYFLKLKSFKVTKNSSVVDYRTADGQYQRLSSKICHMIEDCLTKQMSTT